MFERPVLAPLPDVSPLECSFDDQYNPTASATEESHPRLIVSRSGFTLSLSDRTQTEPAVDHPPESAAQPKGFPPLRPSSTQNELLVPDAETFFDSKASSECDFDIGAFDESPPSPNHLLEDLTAIEVPAGLTEEDITFRSLQPLPPLPVRKPGRDDSPMSLKARAVTMSSSRARILPIKGPRQYDSKASLRSSACTSNPASTDTLRQSTILSDATWEDDVDFCYEVEAESTCNFNWDPMRWPRTNALIRDTSFGAASSPNCSPDVDHAASTTSPVHPIDSPLTDGANSMHFPVHSSERSRRKHGLKTSTSVDNLAERRLSIHKGIQGPSVGHRGFLAARKSSADLNSKFCNPPVRLKQLHHAHITVLPPLYSPMVPDDEELTTTTSTPMTQTKQPGVFKAALHETYLNGPLPVDYISDPESNRHSNSNSESSRPRRSTSFGSCDSVNLRRPAKVPAPTPSTLSAETRAVATSLHRESTAASPVSPQSVHSHTSPNQRPKGTSYGLFPQRRL